MMETTWKEDWKAVGDKFDKMRNLSLTKKLEKCLIVAHGDLDGIVSAIMMREIFKNTMTSEPEVIFTRPHEVKRYNEKAHKKENRGIKTDIYDFIIVVDIAVNNRDPQSTINFVNSVKNKLLWIDHHPTTVNLPTCIIQKKESCVKLISEIFPHFKFNKKVLELIEYADKTDQGDGDNVFDHSLKINLRSDEARYEIYRYGKAFVGGVIEDNDYWKILRKDSRHKDLVRNSDEVYNTLRTTHGNISIVDMREYRDKTINSTYLFHKCYDDTPVVIFKYLSTRKEDGGEEYLKIARSNACRLHLPSLFGLKSGAAYRITIPNMRSLTSEEKANPKLTEGKRITKGKCMYSDAEIVKKLEDGLKRIKYKK